MESKSIHINNIDGESKEFIIRKIPALAMKAIIDNMDTDQIIPLLKTQDISALDVDDHEQLAQLENEILDYNLSFFKSRKRIRIPTFKNKFTPQDYANADPFIASIISSGMATYLQLKNELSLEEAFTLWEISTTNKINEMKAVES